MSNGLLPEFTLLNDYFGEQAWCLNYADSSYLVTAIMSKEQREKIKKIAAEKLPTLTIYENSIDNALSFNRKELIAHMKGKHPLNLVEKVISKRRSGYHFDPHRSPSEELLNRVFNGARHAPSAYHLQPWRFIVCNKATHMESYQKLYHLLPPHTKPWIGDAPVLIIVVAANKAREETPTGIMQVSNNQWTVYDTGAASVSMMLVATSLGMMTHQIGGFDPEELVNCFKIEPGFKPIAVMAIGYNIEKEMKDKARKPIDEIFFKGIWGNKNG